MKGVKLYYVPETRQFVPAEQRPRRESGPVVIQDSCDPFVSHADGKVYDSKSAYRRELKSRGFVELGSDKVSERPRDIAPGLRNDIVRAYRDHWK